jgi:hypothetical protein
MAQDNSRKMLQLYAPVALIDAVKVAADREMTSISEFVRRVLIERLRSDGIDLGRVGPHHDAAAHEHVAA